MQHTCLFRLNIKSTSNLVSYGGGVVRLFQHPIGCLFSTQAIDESTGGSHFDVTEPKKHEFPVLNLLPYSKPRREQRIVIRNETISPRYKRMAINQDWGSVWPAARTFHPSSVPLPIHMSYIDDNKLRPPIGKYNNPELLKIPNFLHLTPPVVKRQCKALMKFCTKWPEALRTDQDCDRHFPVQVITQDFVFSAPTIRWPDSRIVVVSFKLDSLELDEHARDKMKRLLRDRYDPSTDTVTIRTDSCPLRKQNYDYAQYLLTALYFESWTTEPWESEKEYSDWERYFWDKSQSCRSMSDYLRQMDPKKYATDDAILKDKKVQKYAKAVADLCSNKESTHSLDAYKRSVLDIVFQ